MVSTDTIRTVVGIIGNGTALGIFLSPVPTFYRIWKNKTVEEFSSVPYLAALFNCMLWVVYGLPMVHPNSRLVLSINAVGLAIELSYVLIYIWHVVAHKLVVILVLLAEFASAGAVAVTALTLVHGYDHRSKIVGILCAIFGTLMYAAPFSVMRLVIKTKSVEYMPLFLSVICFFNGVCWTIYALVQFDLYIIIPNGLGVIFAAAQLVLHVIYHKSTKVQQEARKNAKLGLVEIMAVNNEYNNSSNARQNGS